MEMTEIATTTRHKLPDPGIGDRISSLPDEILYHILSFLQTRYAVGTSVLSRRWKGLWTGVYNLDLDNRYNGFVNTANCSETRQRRDLEFCRFVGSVLSLHKNLNSLRRFRFHLALDYLDCELRPNFWLKIVFASDESQLEEIDFKLEGPERIVSAFPMHRLPESFYSLKRLKVLKLDGVLIEPSAKGSVLLPSVKVLQLLEVEIKDCESLNSLISGCPVVETVHLEKCYSLIRKEKNVVTASLPSLKNLRIVGWSYHDNNMFCPIVFEAPSLEHLYLRDFAELQFRGTSNPLPCLHSARVDFGLDRISEHGLIRFLAQISNAKEMRLSWEILSLLSDVDDGVQLPMFPNLTHLTIQLVGSSCILHSLLNSASKLQSLVIGLEGRGSMKWEDSKEPTCAPECLLSCLEEIKIEKLKADEDEMKMVAYLLKAGAVLRKVNMHVTEDDDHDIYMQYCNYTQDRICLGSLLKLPRGSSACETHLFFPNSNEILFCNDNETGSDDEFEGIDDDDTDEDNYGTD